MNLIKGFAPSLGGVLIFGHEVASSLLAFHSNLKGYTSIYKRVWLSTRIIVVTCCARIFLVSESAPTRCSVASFRTSGGLVGPCPLACLQKIQC